MICREKIVHHLSLSRPNQSESLRSIRFPFGVRAFNRFFKAYAEWNGKLGIGSFVTGDRAFLYVAPSKYSERRIVLVKGKIGGHIEVEE